MKFCGYTVRHNAFTHVCSPQVGIFYRNVLSEEERTRLTNNIAGHVVNAAEFIQERCVEMFTKCDPEYGARIAKRLQELKA